MQYYAIIERIANDLVCGVNQINLVARVKSALQALLNRAGFHLIARQRLAVIEERGRLAGDIEALSKQVLGLEAELHSHNAYISNLKASRPALSYASTINSIVSVLPTSTGHCQHASQILLLSKCDSEISPLIKAAMRSFQESLPGGFYKLYNMESTTDFLRDNFDSEVLEAFCSLRAFAHKAALARYCILYKQGGWYSDISNIWCGPFDHPPRASLIAFRDIQRDTFSSWACQNSIIYAQAGHPSIAKAIEIAIKNCKTRYYGATPLCPVGTTALGRAIAETADPRLSVFGDFVELTPHHVSKNRAFVMPDGKILAFYKSSGGGDIRSLGMSGSNSYNDVWHSRTMYSEDVSD